MMAIKFGWEPPSGYPEDKDRQVSRFCDLVISNAPDDIEFSSSEIKEKLKLNADDANWYGQVAFDVYLNLERKGYVGRVGNLGMHFFLTEKGYNKKYGINSNPHSTHYHAPVINARDISSSQIIQDSRFEESPISNTHISTPNANDKKQSPIVSFLLKFWWTIIIPLAIGIILIYFEIFTKG